MASGQQHLGCYGNGVEFYQQAEQTGDRNTNCNSITHYVCIRTVCNVLGFKEEVVEGIEVDIETDGPSCTETGPLPAGRDSQLLCYLITRISNTGQEWYVRLTNRPADGCKGIRGIVSDLKQLN